MLAAAWARARPDGRADPARDRTWTSHGCAYRDEGARAPDRRAHDRHAAQGAWLSRGLSRRRGGCSPPQPAARHGLGVPCISRLGDLALARLSLADYLDHMYGNADDVVAGRQCRLTSRARSSATTRSARDRTRSSTRRYAWAASAREDIVKSHLLGDARKLLGLPRGMKWRAVQDAPRVLCRNTAGRSAPRRDATARKAWGRRGVRHERRASMERRIRGLSPVREAVQRARR